jgi:hypothetical protein
MSPMETPDGGEPPSVKEIATAIRRLFFAIEILSGLAFVVICYGEMIGLFHSPDTSLPRLRALARPRRWMSP